MRRRSCRDSRAFGVNRLLGDLHRNQVAHIKHIGDFAVFRQIGLKLELVHGNVFASHYPLLELKHRMGLQTQVEIVQKGFFGIAHFNECRIEARQQFLHPAQINVSDRKLVVGLLSVKFDKNVVLQ